MKITHANVKEYASHNGLHENKIDGIPEGFAFVSDDLEIGGKLHGGDFVAFIPLAEWGEEHSMVKARTIFGLQELYKIGEKTWEAKK